MDTEFSMDVATIDLTLPADSSAESDTIQGDNNETCSTPKIKIGRKGIEQYFQDFKEYITGENKGKTSAVCVLCKETVWHLKYSTSNYSRHVQRKHKAEFQSWSKACAKERTISESAKMKQTSIVNSLSPSSNVTRYGSAHPRQTELTNMVFRDFIIDLGLPFSIVEKPAFIRAMATVDSKFRIPSRRALTRDYLPQMYNQINNKLKNICSSVKYLSLAFDGWTDRRLRAFYGVTIHYIDDAGQLRSHLLAFNPLSGSHSGTNLFMEFDRVSTAFSIGNKIVRLITDNASNNISAFGRLMLPGFESYFIAEDDEEENDDDFHEEDLNITEDSRFDSDDENVQNDFDKRELLRLPCFIHTLQLVVKDGLNETDCVRSAMAKVAAIAKLSHQSVLVAEKLQENKLSIPQAVITRWNSQYLTVSTILEIPNVFLNDIMIEHKKNELLLSVKDLAILREFVSVFALFAEVTTRCQSEKCISISLVAPSVLGIYFDLENELKSSKYASSLCLKLMDSLKKRFGGLLNNFEICIGDHIEQKSTSSLFSDEIFLISSFLDGHLRLRWISQSWLPEDAKSRICGKIKNMVIQAALRLYDVNMNCAGQGKVSHGAADADELKTISNDLSYGTKCSGEDGNILKRKSLFAYYDSVKAMPKKQRTDIVDEINEEIMLFLKDSSYETNLVFLKKHQFPHLHRLALRTLCIPASSAPIERIFSKSGLLMRPHRSRLSKDTLSKLTCVQCNTDLITLT